MPASVNLVVTNVYQVRGLGANVYILAQEEGLWLIDAGREGAHSELLLLLDRELGASAEDIRGIILTHWHPDHTGALADLLAEAGEVDVYIHELDAEKILVDVEPKTLQGGEVLPVLGGLRVIHVPGHTPGSIALLGARILFSGDTIIVSGGRPSLPRREFCDDFEQTKRSALILAQQDFDILCPGHGPVIREQASRVVRDALKFLSV